MEKFWH